MIRTGTAVATNYHKEFFKRYQFDYKPNTVAIVIILGSALTSFFLGNTLIDVIEFQGIAPIVAFFFALHQPYLYIFAKVSERLHYVGVFLRTRLQEGNSIRLCESSALSKRDLPFNVTVTLIAHDDLAQTFRLRVVYLSNPVGDVIEGFAICN